MTPARTDVYGRCSSTIAVSWSVRSSLGSSLSSAARRRASSATAPSAPAASPRPASSLPASAANLDIDAERSVLLALAAIDQTHPVDESVLPEAEEALHRAVTASRVEQRVPDVGGSLDWSPDGSTFVTANAGGTIDIRDARTGAAVRTFPGHDGGVTDVAFNHDGTLLATTGDDGALKVWDPATGELEHAVTAPGGRDRYLGEVQTGVQDRRSAPTAPSSLRRGRVRT